MSTTRELIETLNRISGSLEELVGQGAWISWYPPECYVCERSGPGLTVTADGRPVHRWPCRERML